MRELVSYVDASCVGGAECSCAGGALLLAAADALAGRGAGGRALPPHARPSARHDALHALLAEEAGGRSPLRTLLSHDASAGVRLLEQCAREPPFAGPLAKQNRLRVARALLACIADLQVPESIEILEFISGQLQSGALPLEQELIKKIQEFVTNTDNERADLAWLAIITRIRIQRDQMVMQYKDAVPRPRVLWRINAMLDRHDQVLREFFKINNPSDRDINELFEYLRSRIEADGEAKDSLQDYLPALIQLRPQSAAALLDEQQTESIAPVYDSLGAECKIEFGDCLLDSGRLRGDTAASHLRALCVARPSRVKEFLKKNSGIIRPEDALLIVKELGPTEAEPACLEATGDHAGALDCLLRALATAEDESTESDLIEEAGALCVRVGRAVPHAAAAEMWARLLRGADAVPATLLFEAVAFLPPEELATKTCSSVRVARAMLAGGAGRLGAWQCAARLVRREAHESLARALSAARRGLAVRGRCRRCDRPLHAGEAARTAHCARAFHADCEPEASCPCGRRVAGGATPLPPARAPPPRPLPAPDGVLSLVAPPRPDLEGVV